MGPAEALVEASVIDITGSRRTDVVPVNNVDASCVSGVILLPTPDLPGDNKADAPLTRVSTTQC